VITGIPDQSQPKTESETDHSAKTWQWLTHSRNAVWGNWRVDVSTKSLPGAARAQWLSELRQAIDEAQWLAWRIGVVEGRNAQALELYVQLELVRAEVEALQGPRARIEHPSSTAFPAVLDAFGNLTPAGEGLEE
jgi:hypothetical protein